MTVEPSGDAALAIGPGPVNVILVTHDSVFGRYVAAALYNAHAVDRVIIEHGRPGWRFYGRKLRRVGPINAVFQVLLNRWFRREGGRFLPASPLPPHTSVQTINGYPFGPNDLVIGFGTSLITAATLASLRHGFLNLHTGWLPNYRGVKSEYWTLARGDVERAGWTLHYMTPRIDDGDIVLQHTVRVESDTAPQLRARLLEDAVPALVDFIATVRRRGFDTIPRQPQGHGMYFTTPTWRDWLKDRKPRRVTT